MARHVHVVGTDTRHRHHAEARVTVSIELVAAAIAAMAGTVLPAGLPDIRRRDIHRHRGRRGRTRIA